MKPQTISLFVTLSAFWLLNSGHNTLLILLLGLLSIILVLLVTHKMDVIDRESQPFHLHLNIFNYYSWLIKEIVLANFVVIKHIWLGNSSISPTLKRIKITQKTDVGKVIFANSITLTPGTVAVDIIHNEVVVHALLKKDIDSLIAGEMDRRVSLLEY